MPINQYQPLDTISDVIKHLHTLTRNAHCMIKAAMKDALLRAVAKGKTTMASNANTMFGASANKAKMDRANANQTTPTPTPDEPKGPSSSGRR